MLKNLVKILIQDNRHLKSHAQNNQNQKHEEILYIQLVE